MKTRGGVYYDIKESDYKLKRGDYEFKFSSELYKSKFMINVDEFIKRENDKLNAKYNYDNDYSEFLAIIYYKMVEKRGFYVTYKDKLVNENSFIVGDNYEY